MAVTKRDFEAVAGVIKNLLDDCDDASGEDSLLEIAGMLADYFATQNERFKREMFMSACDIIEVA